MDDSLFGKTGDKIEGIGKVFDHVSRKCVLGFRCLLYGFWDGKSIIPLDFSYHAEKGRNQKHPYGLTLKKLKLRFSKERREQCPGSKRIKELKKMLKNSAKRCRKLDSRYIEVVVEYKDVGKMKLLVNLKIARRLVCEPIISILRCAMTAKKAIERWFTRFSRQGK